MDANSPAPSPPPYGVLANHFQLEFKDKEFYVYNVEIDPSPGHLWYMAIERAKQKLAIEGGFAYNNKRLYTTNPLPLPCLRLKVQPWHTQFVVCFTFVARWGKHSPEALKMAETVLSPSPSCSDLRYSYFYHGLLLMNAYSVFAHTTDLGNTVSIDLSFPVFIQKSRGIEFVEAVIQRCIDPEGVAPDSGYEVIEVLRRVEAIKVANALKGVLAKMILEPSKQYILSGLTEEPTADLRFSEDTELIEYYNKTYGIVLKFPKLPSAFVEMENKTVYIPLELCEIVEQKYGKQLTQGKIGVLKQNNSINAFRRKDLILERVRAFKENRSLEEFGLSVQLDYTTVKAYRLTAPTLQFRIVGVGLKGRRPDHSCSWKYGKKKVYLEGSLKNWILLHICENFNVLKLNKVYGALRKSFLKLGMILERPEMGHVTCQKPVEQHLHETLTEKLKGGKYDLVFVIIPDESYHDEVKHLLDREVKVASQLCLWHNIEYYNSEVATSLAVKINAKVGGKNVILARSPCSSYNATMICGAYMDNSCRERNLSYSVAGVVAAIPDYTNYIASVESYYSGEKFIKNLSKAFRWFIMEFESKVGKLPDRIIIYRGGTSVGHYQAILRKEVKLIHEACCEFNFKPKITIIWVEMLDNTSFFPMNYDDALEENIWPGTLVDSRICHSSDFDFFLCSNSCLKGTCGAVYYNVIVDENNFSREEVYTMTYHLCFMYPGATHSISTVAPVRCAKRAARQVECYMKHNGLGVGVVYNLDNMWYI